MATNLNALLKNKQYDVLRNYISKQLKNYPLAYSATKLLYKLDTSLPEDFRHWNNRIYKFSVITINFNNIEGLKRTISSVESQTKRSEIQFIVIDGGSTDGSVDFITKNSDKIELSVSGKDGGVYDAMNKGIDFAQSEFTIYMNSGDAFDDSMVIENIMNSIAQSKQNVDVVYGSSRRETGVIWKCQKIENLWKGNICSHQSIFFRTSLISKTKHDLGLKIVADYAMIYDLYLSGASFLETSVVVSDVEKPGISDDFKARTLERWQVVRGRSNPLISIEEIDSFYLTLLQSDPESGGAHHLATNQPFARIITNIEERLVFLISMPRSGSTLLQKIIESSPDVESCAEPWVMLPILSHYNSNLVDSKFSTDLSRKAFDLFNTEFECTSSLLDAQKLYSDSIYSNVFRKIKSKYFLDKTPRYVHIVNELKTIYPKAKYIVLLRDPLAIVSSYASTWFSNDYKKLLNDKFSRYDIEHGFDRLAEFIESDFKNKIIIRYEDLLSSPEKECKRVFNYLGLKYDSKYIDYGASGKSSNYVLGDPKLVNRKSRPDPSNIYSWINDIRKSVNMSFLPEIMKGISNNSSSILGYDIDASFQKTIITPEENCKLVWEEVSNVIGIEKPACLTSKSKRPTVGILITCYNNASTIGTAIYSVLNQSLPPDTIYIADDCSTDNSIEIINQILSQNKKQKFVLFKREHNMGVAKNRDLAIRNMDVDYFSTLDGDDLYWKFKLSHEIESIQNNNCIVYSDILIRNSNGYFLQNTHEYSQASIHDNLSRLLSRSAPVPRDMLVPVNLYLQSGGFDHDLNIYEDWSLKMRLMNLAGNAGWIYSGSVGTIYDRRSPGLSGRNRTYHSYGQLIAIKKSMDHFGDNSNLLLAGVKTAAGHLEGGTKIRFEQLCKHASDAPFEFWRNKFDVLECPAFNSWNDEMIGKYLYTFSEISAS